jgi:DNA-binding GntR family transcriptional regulator
MTAAFSRPPTAQEAVLTELRSLIASGRMGPGQRIVQEALAGRLGVSRVPLREALKILEGEGQVTYEAHRGYVVSLLSLPDLVEVYRIRELLEPEAVRTAVPLLTVEDLEKLESAARDVESAAGALDVSAMTLANRRLHDLMFEACGQPRLVRMIRQLWDATEVYRAVYYADRPNREQVISEHRQLVEAVRRSDADEANRILDQHRRHAIEALRPALVDDTAPGSPDPEDA